MLFLEVIFTVVSKTTEKDVWEKNERSGGVRKGQERTGERV